MKKIYSLLVLCCAFVATYNAQAQVTGTKTIGTDYATLAAAITALNTSGISGNVIINVPAGYAETAPAGGYKLGSATLNASVTASATLIIKKSGTGANPLLTAATGTSTTVDGIFFIQGTDYVTIDGISLAEAAANTTTTTQMEWGYALVKRQSAAPFDGCQYVTIKNCAITLNAANTASVGIYANNHIATATTALTITATTDAMNNCMFSADTIRNTNTAISLRGYVSAASPYTLYDQNNTVGGSAATGNVIQNYASAAAGYGVNLQYQNNPTVSYNSIDNLAGGGVAAVSTVYGVGVSSGTNISTSIANNTINLSQGSSSATYGVYHALTSTSTINVTSNQISFSGGTSGIDYGIYFSGAMNNINVSTNVFYNINIATTGSLYLIYHTGSASPFNYVCNGNYTSGPSTPYINKTGGGSFYGHYDASSSSSGTTIYSNNNFSYITGVSTFYGIYDINGGTGQTKFMRNNILSNITTTSTFYGFYQGYSATQSISNCRVSDINAGAASVYAIYTSSSTTTDTINNCRVSNITTTGSSIYGIYLTSSGTTLRVYGDTVNGLSTSYSSGGAYGIYQTVGTTVDVFKNVLYDISATGTTGTVYGMYLNAGTVNVWNNLIGDLRTPAYTTSTANSGTQLVGIYCGAATAHTLSHNTVYLNGTSTGANFGSSAVYALTSNTTFRNNIFVNVSTPNGTGMVAAYRRSATGLTGYQSATNNNLFYAGTPVANKVILYDGTTAYQTMATYQALVAPGDAASMTENVNFQATAGGGANFLKPNMTTPTVIESGGIVIAGLTDDIYGTVRAGNAGYTGTGIAPDLGAVEADYVLLDLSAPLVTYTPLTFTCLTTDRVITATISDVSGAPTSGTLMPRIYYKKNSGAWYSSQGVLASGTGNAGTWNFTIASADMGGVAIGDIISYYVVAQDLVATPNIGSVPAGVIATNVNSITTPPTPYTYNIGGTFSGTYNVGAGGDFATITAAVNTYNTSCLVGPVTYLLTSSSYPSETYPITILSNPYASATNTLTIKPAAGISPVISGNITTSVFKLNGADYTTIDGSNTVGGTTRDLTISNTNTGTSGNAVIWIASASSANGASNNAIKNCVIAGNSSTSTEMCIFSGGSAGTGAFSAGYNALTGNSSNTIQNNLFKQSQYGVWLKGTSTTTLDNSNQVLSNDFGTATTSEGFSAGGLVMQFQNNATISKNNIQNVRGTGGVTNAAGTSTVFTGLYIRQCTNNAVSQNKVFNFAFTGTGANRTHVIYSESPAFNTSTAPSNNTFVNNAVYDARVTSTGPSTWTISGIGLNGGYGDKFYFNTVNLTGIVNVTSGPAAAFSNGNGATTVQTSNVTLRDNIFVVNGSSSSTAATFYAEYWYSTTALTGSVLNNNDLSVAVSSGGTGYTGYNAASKSLLSDWQTATSQEANSINTLPLFVSNTDPHLAVSGTNMPLISGAAISGVTTDIDGTTRSSTTPVIGVHELTIPLCTGTPTGVTVNTTISYGCSTYSPVLSLSGVTASGLSYQWQSSPDSTTWTNASGATNATYSPSISSTIYYRCVVACISTAGSMNTPGVKLVYSTSAPLPYTESFEGITATNTLPPCMASTNMGTYTYTYMAATGSYNQAAHTGSKFASFRYGANDWFFTAPISVVAGQSYQFSFWYVTDGYSGWNTLQAKYGTSQTAAGMTGLVGTAVTGVTNTTYAQYVGVFTATTTGIIYVGINCSASTYPVYLSIDDISLTQLPDCAGTPSGISVNASQTWGCSSYSPTLSLSGITGSGISFQWQSSTDNTTWTNVSGATASTYAPTVGSSIYYRCVVTCVSSGGFMNTASVNLGMSTTAPLPYNESFEGLTAANALPPCMAATNLANYTLTYLGATGSFNQAGHTGTKFASFLYGANDWFFTPGFAVTAGNVYRFSFWYVTDGYSGWTTLQAKYGTAQTAAGMTTAVGTALSGPINTTYAQYVGTFTATSTGTIYLGINCVATTSPDYLTIDDINFTLLPQCTGTPSGITVNASQSWGCSSYSSTLSLSDVTTLGYSYQWQSSTDSATWTNVSGATNASYIATVTASTYYRCVVTCIASSGAMNTPGVKLQYSTTAPLPYTESFESITAANALPSCMAATNLATYTKTYIAPTGLYNQAAHTGSKFASFRYGSADWFFTPGFAVTAGKSYQFSFWYVTDGYSGWNTLQAKYGTSQTAAGMTTPVGTAVSSPLNTTYAQYTGVFTASTTGIIYIGINCNASTSPEYLSIDDINLTQVPDCAGTPTGISVNASQTWSCSSYSPTLSLSGVASSGISFQWQSSTDSTTWTNVSGATASIYTPTVTSDIYYRCVVTCVSSGGFINTAGVKLAYSTSAPMPYTESFEGITTANTLPPCMAATNLATYTKTYLTATGSYNQVAHTGTKFASFRYGSADWFFTAPIAVTAGKAYQFSFWYITDGYSGWNTLQAMYGTSQTAAGMTIPIGTPVLSPLNTTYAQYTGVFTASTTGIIYIGINCNASTSPLYLSIDDINVTQLPDCAGTPAGISVNASQTWGCSSYTPMLSLSGVTGSSMSFQWQSSLDSATWTNVSGATNATYTPTVSSPIYYRCVVTCASSGGFMNTAGVKLMYSVTMPLPYTESFEGIAGANTLPPCMAATNLGTMTRTYTAATGSYNQAARTGSRFASFRYGAADWFFTAPIAVVAGKSYQFSFWYVTDGYSGWNTLQAMYGTSQTAAGMITPVGTAVSSPINTSYAQYTGVFTASTTGIIYIGINCTASTSPDYLTIDDINVTQLPDCAGTPTGISVNASQTYGCSSYSPTLSLLGVTGSGMSFQWQSSLDSATWTNVSGATSGIYTPTVSSTVYYRCVVTCAASGGFMNTAGVKLVYSATTPLPYTESFEGIAAANTLPPCMAATNLGTLTRTYTATTSIYNQAARTGTKFASFRYSANDWFFTPPFAVTAGSVYQFSFWYVTDGYSGWTTLQAKYGTAQTSAGMTTAVGTAVSAPLNTTYAQYVGTFTATSTGTIYIGINCVATISPEYLSIDDINFSQVVCTGTPTAGTVSSTTSLACPGYTPTLSTSGTSVAPGIQYQWQSSPDNTAWTNITGATGTTFVPTVAAATYYRANVSCSYSGLSAAAPGVQLSVNPLPASIGGTTAVCPGFATSLSNSTGGGTWQSENIAVGTINSSTGMLQGITAGTTTVSYTLTSTGCRSTQVVTVNAPPPAIAGTMTVCATSATTLSNTSGGGTWATNSAGIASVGSSDGIVTGNSSGLTLITYTSTAGCYTVTTVTVDPLPATTISPASATVCLGDGATITAAAPLPLFSLLSEDFNGGIPLGWTVANIAGLPSSYWQVVDAPSPGAGALGDGTKMLEADANASSMAGQILNTIITSPSFSTLGYASATLSFNQYLLSLPTDATVAVEYSIDNGTTWTSMLDQVGVGFTLPGGGTGEWSAVDPEVSVALPPAAVNAANVKLRWNYNSNGGVQWDIDNIKVTAEQPPVSFSWSGPSGLACVPCATNTITPTATGTGVYTLTSTTAAGCNLNQQVTVSVNPLPANIDGELTVCVNSTTTLSNTSGVGTWSSASANVAVSGTSGVVTGQTAGTATVTYTSATGCIATAVVTINALPSASTGSLTVCEGTTSPLTNTTPGGTWSSANTSVASVDASGIVSGANSGNTDIYYTLTLSGCRVASPVTVNNAPAIDGTLEVCEVATTTLSNTESGGTWVSGSTAFATVDASSGVVTGVLAGNTTVTYTLANGCHSMAVVTVNELPADISGTPHICLGSSTSLSDGTTGGDWLSGNTLVASVDASGVVTGAAAGNVMITYQLSVTGCAKYAALTVDALPSAISGTQEFCQGTTTTLSNAVGGTWSSNTTGIATVDVDGVVTGVTDGIATITYTAPTSCIATTDVTVDPTPADITGTPVACEGLTTALADGTVDGSWSSSAFGVVVVDPASGVVTGMGQGIATITYQLLNTCFKTQDVTINPLPAAIAETAQVCVGATKVLTSASTGGTWTSDDAGIADIGSSSGILSGMTTGNARVTYTLPTGCNIAAVVTVDPLPAGITGSLAACLGVTSALLDADADGSWSSGNTTIAGVDANTGFVTGVAAGNASVTYTLPTGCHTSATLTVNPLPAPITGIPQACEGASAMFTNGSLGGNWSSSTPLVAAIDASGNITAAAAGTTLITYTLPTGCLRTRIFTVNAQPAASTGSLSVCQSATTLLSNTMSGGAWVSGTPGVATVNTSGLVSGNTSGVAPVSYVMPSGCHVVSMVTVSAMPASISGAGAVCENSAVNMTDATSGGSWASGNAAVAAVDAATGIVTGVAAGGTVISYTMPSGCAAVRNIVVNAAPAAVAGGGPVCTGSNLTLSNTATGGIWASSNTAIATVGLYSGIVTGSNAGTITVSYTLINGCSTTTQVTVNPTPSAITGPLAVCNGQTVALTSTTPGGSWSSDNVAVATVGTTGSVTTLAPGNATITYALGAGCMRTARVTVNANPAVYNVTGGGSYCESGAGVHIGLDGSNTGITYQLQVGSSPVSSAMTGTGSLFDFGAITGAATYNVIARDAITGCATNMSGTASVTVNPLVTPSVTLSASADSICAGTNAIFTATTTNGGAAPTYVWKVNGVPATGATSSTYAYIPANADVVTLAMSSSEACVTTASATASKTMTVNAKMMPVTAAGVAPASVLCEGATATFTATSGFGGTAPSFRWYKNGAIAASGSTYAYVPSSGDVVFVRMFSNYDCRLADSVQSSNVTMTTVPVFVPTVSITADPSLGIAPNTNVTLTANVSGAGSAPTYQWYIGSVPVAGAHSNIFSSTTFHDGDSVSCQVMGSGQCGMPGFNSVIIRYDRTGITTVQSGSDIHLVPNPNKGEFTVKGTLAAKSDGEATIEVTSMLGQVVYRGAVTVKNGSIDQRVKLDNTLANGMYLLNLVTENEKQVFHFMIEQ